MKTMIRSLQTITILLLPLQIIHAQEFRPMDGSANNLIHLDWGAAGVHVLNGTVGYADGISAPSGPERPNARFISNMLFAQNTIENDPRTLSAYTWVWGQFIDHDITLSPDNPDEILHILVPSNDPYFDPIGTGTEIIPMNRSDYDPTTGTGISNPRAHYNGITAYIDGSAVYGSDDNHARWLRTFTDGKLKTSTGNLLPFNTLTGEYNGAIDPLAPQMAMPFPFVTVYFVAGDVRANENPFLTALHTLFVREHNRLCDVLSTEHPSWTDEYLYQYARKLVGGLLQAIVYEEWLPTLGMEVAPYDGYDPSINPGIMNVFNAAAYRYGHTTITSLLVRMDNEGNYIPEGDILLRDAFFNPSATTSVGGIEPYLIGMATVVQQDFDCKVIDDLRNFLFGNPGSGGMDLVALNINRGRDRGLPDYNTIRTDFGLQPHTFFDEISEDPLMNQSLEFVYGDINSIDPWVGMLAEDHMDDALFGETAMTIVKKQFMAIRDGDRYYYESDPWLTAEEIAWIKETRLSDVIKRNTSATIVQKDIFIAQPLVSSTNAPEDTEKLSFVMYPNPVQYQASLRIEARQSRDAVLQIIDLQGRFILHRTLRLLPGNNIVSLTMPQEMQEGMYIAMVTDGSQILQKRFVKID